MKHPMAPEHLARLDRVLGDLRILHAVGLLGAELLAAVYQPLDARHTELVHEWARDTFAAPRSPAQPIEDEAAEPAPNSPEDLGGYTAPPDAQTNKGPTAIRDAWLAANRHYRALIAEAALSRPQRDMLDAWLREYWGVSSLTEVPPARVRQLCDHLAKMSPADRTAWALKHIGPRVAA